MRLASERKCDSHLNESVTRIWKNVWLACEGKCDSHLLERATRIWKKVWLASEQKCDSHLKESLIRMWKKVPFASERNCDHDCYDYDYYCYFDYHDYHYCDDGKCLTCMISNALLAWRVIGHRPVSSSLSHKPPPHFHTSLLFTLLVWEIILLVMCNATPVILCLYDIKCLTCMILNALLAWRVLLYLHGSHCFTCMLCDALCAWCVMLYLHASLA